MRFNTLKQKGSESRDRFKYLHKHLLGKDAWALDADLMLVEKSPRPFIVALLDFKMPGDGISFTEAIAYSKMIELGVAVYLVEANVEFRDKESDPSTHLFDIYRLDSADYHPDPPTYTGEYVLNDVTWEGLAAWEKSLRMARKKEYAEKIQDELARLRRGDAGEGNASHDR